MTTSLALPPFPPRGTSLPTTPADGDEYHYVADAANGIVWRFKYNAGSASAFKWEFVGGPPLKADVATFESTASTTYVALATAGPSITVPLQGDYYVSYGALGVTGGSSIVFMSFDVGGTGALDVDAARYGNSAANQVSVARLNTLKTGLAASTALVAKYRTSASTGSWQDRYMRVLPVRCLT